MATIDLGRVTPIFHGDYDNTATYELNDIVLYDGLMYWHVSDTPTTGTLPTDTTVWTLAVGYTLDDAPTPGSANPVKSGGIYDAIQAAATDAALAAYPTDTVSGPIVSFPDGADGIPVKALAVQISSVGGVTGATILVTGANVWDEQWEQGIYDSATGAPISGNYVRSANAHPIPVVAGQSYAFYCASARVSQLYWYDADGTFISNTSNPSANPFVTTAPAGAAYVRFNLPGGYGTTYKDDVAVNYPSTVTTYAPYSGTEYAVDWTDEAGTVYTGTLTYKGSGVWEIDDGTPVELTGPDPATLLGANVIQADCGDVDVTYRADMALYIQKLLGA